MCSAKLCLLSLGLQAEQGLWPLCFGFCCVESRAVQGRPDPGQRLLHRLSQLLSIDDLQFSESSSAAWKSSATALCENRLECWKGWVLCCPQTACRINGPAASKSMGPVHILCRIILIQNGHRELSKISPRGSSNKKQANEQNLDYFVFCTSEFQLLKFM